IVQKFREKSLTMEDSEDTESPTRTGHTTGIRDSPHHPKLENRSHRSECIPGSPTRDEFFRLLPSAPPDRARCRPSQPAPGQLRTAALPGLRFAGRAVL